MIPIFIIFLKKNIYMQYINIMLPSLLNNYIISDSDLSKPWGSYYCIDSSDISRFIKDFFSDSEYIHQINTDKYISPKLLFINPNSRLSWQYHNRRKEIWKVVIGPVGIVRSFSDLQPDLNILHTGDVVLLDSNERHRLVGLDNHSIIAELWIHTDITNLSDESDIVRVHDDYSR